MTYGATFMSGYARVTVSDGAAAAHLAVAVDDDAAAATADRVVTWEWPTEPGGRPRRDLDTWDLVYTQALHTQLVPVLTVLLADPNVVELVVGLAATWEDNPAGDPKSALRLIEAATALAS